MRIPLFFRALTVLVVAPAAAFSAASQSLHVDDGTPVSISATDLTEGCSSVVKPVRVTVENRSSESVTYAFTLSSDGDVSVTRSLTVPANATRSLVLVVPTGSDSGWGYTTLTTDGPGLAGGTNASFSSGRISVLGEAPLQVGLSTKLNADFGGRWKKSLEPSAVAGASRGSAEAGVAPIDTARLAGDWRVYRGLIRITMTAEEWREACATPEARDALLRYAGAGGIIGVLAGKDAPVPLVPSGDILRFGFGSVRVTREDAKRAMDAFEKGSDQQLKGNPFAIPLLVSTNDPVSPLERLLPPSAQAGFLVGLIIVLFAVVVGPVNLFVFCGGDRRHRMLWLTPLIAVVFSIAIGVYVFVADGTGGEGFRRRVRLRPAGTTWEFLMQEQSSRTGLLLGSSFNVPEDALFRQVKGKSESSTFRGNSTAVQRLSGPVASGDWFKSRFVQSQSLEMWNSERGGVELTGTEEAPEILSRIQGTLTKVFVRSAGGMRCAENVGPGARVATRAATKAEFEAWYTALREDCSASQLARLDLVKDSDGWWYAECPNLEAASPDTLGSVRWKNKPDIIVGDLTVSGAVR